MKDSSHKKDQFIQWLRDHYDCGLFVSQIADAAENIFCNTSYSKKISIGSIEDNEFFPHGPDITETERKKMSGARDDVFQIMKDGEWRTLEQIQGMMFEYRPIQSIAIYLRSFRESQYGGHTVNKRKVGKNRLFEYQLILRNS